MRSAELYRGSVPQSRDFFILQLTFYINFLKEDYYV